MHEFNISSYRVELIRVLPYPDFGLKASLCGTWHVGVNVAPTVLYARRVSGSVVM